MIIIRNLRFSLDTDFDNLKCELGKKLGFDLGGADVKLYKKSIDARKKSDVFFNVSVTISANNEDFLLKKLKKYKAEIFEENEYIFKKAKVKGQRPVVVGFGPAGMFAALTLARAGLKPIVLELGADADQRKRDVDAFFSGGRLKENSNIQFGEGGAGTFSDGKLNTGINDPRIRAVLKVFVEHGANDNILYDSKPHIGTDVLIGVVKSIRKEIISLGGEVLFNHKVVGINVFEANVKGVEVQTSEGIKTFECNRLVLAPGHSARDTFELLKRLNIKMEPKPFAIGVRIEHFQKDINRMQYGDFAKHEALGAADYRLAVHLEDGRGVFTFCMCPGGEVVNASSEQGGVVVNGMSNSKRDGQNANSAVLVGVSVDDFYHSDVLDGMYFQRSIEQRAFEVGNGLPVAQTLGNFLGISATGEQVKPTVKTGVTFGEIDACLPQFVVASLKDGVKLFDKKMNGYLDPNAVIIAPETRSSSPVRIIRNQNGMASVEGLLPCGEGAGYAGGITSAAVDGIKVAEKIIEEHI